MRNQTVDHIRLGSSHLLNMSLFNLFCYVIYKLSMGETTYVLARIVFIGLIFYKNDKLFTFLRFDTDT